MMVRRSSREARLVTLGSRVLNDLLLNVDVDEDEWGKERLREAIDRIDRFGAGNNALEVFVALIRQCGNVKASSEGSRVHAYVSDLATTDTFLGNLLIQMYGKCSCPDKARLVFDKLLAANCYTWTNLLTAYAQNGDLLHAQELFTRIPNHGTVAWTIMVTALAKNGHISTARQTFEEMPERNIVSWNALITAYAREGHRIEALRLFCRMDIHGFKPNDITFIAILESCDSPGALCSGRLVHELLKEESVQNSSAIGTALVSMYGNCGSPEDARQVFDGLAPWQRTGVVWNAVISAYARNERGKQAVDMFRFMDLEGTRMCQVTLVCVLDACASLGDLAQGMVIHDTISCSKFASDIIVANALLNMYWKCSSLVHVEAVFGSIKEPNVVSWSTLISAQSNIGDAYLAFTLFQNMELEGVTPSQVTLVAALDACSKLDSPSFGRHLHLSMIDCTMYEDLVLATALVNMYAKCGSLGRAWSVFCGFPDQDIVLCNAMLTALVQNGRYHWAVSLFRHKELEGMQPTKVTFVAVLSACAQAGLLKDGLCYFMSLGPDYGILPGTFHYECMVDLLGRAGLLDDAEDLINNMPFAPDDTAWLSLLSACKSHSDLVRAERIAQRTNPQEPASYVLLSQASVYYRVK